MANALYIETKKTNLSEKGVYIDVKFTSKQEIYNTMKRIGNNIQELNGAARVTIEYCRLIDDAWKPLLRYRAKEKKLTQIR